ncbi:MAG: hypothetical protein A3B37_02330 [Candidatus Sungbacteria bacterium RIFCSPLOWO2_01_FULL_59_16]|uniref:Uncharacterized protein n=1 Tax=Candidatus Sungbacteria bacterium RIFCSPLOWO2_01_FULL_59_16 TaxID=1802280 RepID=A0A1G2LCN4_9BACT|nr:MAG: hypothetical protein A3B37_02330 [Candidatus Sungbacteria bacterium RIFCSPLOWO2_01_FULL_59_16]
MDMNIALAMASILAITALAYGATRFFRIAVCPICAGVSATWIGMLAAKTAGYAVESSVIALLMGGTVVGIAYQIERRLAPGRSSLLEKTLFIPTGFIAAYSLLTAAYQTFSVSVGLAALIALFFLRQREPAPSARSDRTADLEERMKQCC